jgi:tetratricopeptide (TPR) repeat protein
LESATAELAVYNFRGARKLFEQALAESGDRAEALFGLAVCLQHVVPTTRENIAAATELYERVSARAPESHLAARALLNLGRIRELRDYFGDEPDLPGARERYAAVVARWPEEAIAHEATLRLAGTYLQTFDPAQVRTGIAVLKEWLGKHPRNPLAAAMWEYAGDAHYFPLREYREALACYRRADELGLLLRGKEGPVYWRMAVIADRHLNDRAVAIEYYTKIITKTPTSGKAYESQLALQRLGAPVPQIALFPDMTGAPP